MGPLTRLLVPTDLSPGAAPALDAALRLAEREGAEVVLLHVFAYPHDWYYLRGPGMADLRSAARDEAQGRLKALARLHATLRVPVRTRLVARAAVAPAVLAAAGRERAAVIVMGTRGWTGSAGGLGSVTAQVTREARCPVLAVPVGEAASAPDAPLFRRVVVPSDLSERAVADLRGAHAVAARYGAPLLVLHVVGEELCEAAPLVGEEVERRVARFAERALGRPAEVEVELQAASIPASGILRAVEGDDLLVLAPHTASGLVERVLAGAPCPVLIVNGPVEASPPRRQRAHEAS